MLENVASIPVTPAAPPAAPELHHQFLTGPSLRHLRKMPDRSVDLVIGSPPYDNARTYGRGLIAKGPAWVEEYFPLYMECLRVCRGIVAWVVQGVTEDRRWSASPALLMARLAEQHGVYLRNPLIYARNSVPGSGGKDWFRSDYDWIICATRHRGLLPWSDNTACGHPPLWGPGGPMSNRTRSGRRVNQWGAGPNSGATRRASGARQAAGRPSHVIPSKETDRPWGNKQGTCGRRPDGTPKRAYFLRAPNGHDADGNLCPNRKAAMPAISNPGNIIWCVVGGNQMGHKLAHRNEAPFTLKLAEFFVRSLCPPGGVVLDPFGGSGTVTHAAEIHGRNSIYIDLRASQTMIAKKRLRMARDALLAAV